MKKSRFTDEQIIGFLKQVEGGVPVKDLCRKHGFSDATFYKWRSRLGGLDVSEARRLRERESDVDAAGAARTLLLNAKRECRYGPPFRAE